MDILASPENTNVQQPGLGYKAWLMDVNDILSMDLPDKTTATTYAGRVTMVTPIVMKPTKAAVSLEIMYQSGELTGEYEGEPNALAPSASFKFAKKGIYADVLGFADFIANQKLVIIVSQECGNYYLLGNHCRPIVPLKISIVSGKKKGESAMVSFECEADTGILMYDGDPSALETPAP